MAWPWIAYVSEHSSNWFVFGWAMASFGVHVERAFKTDQTDRSNIGANLFAMIFAIICFISMAIPYFFDGSREAEKQKANWKNNKHIYDVIRYNTRPDFWGTSEPKILIGTNYETVIGL